MGELKGITMVLASNGPLYSIDLNTPQSNKYPPDTKWTCQRDVDNLNRNQTDMGETYAWNGYTWDTSVPADSCRYKFGSIGNYVNAAYIAKNPQKADPGTPSG